MLKLVDIIKNYGEKDSEVHALHGVSIEFRKSEFVSILGPSGCGKTTLLNIIGGLDKYNSGDLIINGVSTKNYQDKDWDAYRNRTIGFVFQDYNLVSHLTVLGNVELALTLSGIGKQERKQRALKALEQVGLNDHVKKHPNQLSGGQKQRVAIARAIVNNPKVILADEPTGALDSNTSVQIMDILKAISKDRLVIMVTHNEELAKEYSTRIVSLLDGKVTSDTNPYKGEKPQKDKSTPKTADKKAKNKTSMSYFTAVSLSLKNLMTKKTRTILTAFAGSIGIIGIALVLAMSNGFSNYMDDLQRDTLNGMPITIGQTAMKTDISQMTQDVENQDPVDSTVIKPYEPSLNDFYHYNNITQDYVDYIENMDTDLYKYVIKNWGVNINILSNTIRGPINLSDKITSGLITEIMGDQESIEKNYKLVDGKYPTSYDEIVLIVDSQNKISTLSLMALGFNVNADQQYEASNFLNKEFKVVYNDEFYYYDAASQTYKANAIDLNMFNNPNNLTLKIVGVVQNNISAVSSMFSTSVGEGIGFYSNLSTHVHEIHMQSQVALAQRAAGVDKNVLTGEPFQDRMEDGIIRATAEQNYISALMALGGYNLPKSINIYTTDFDTKQELKNYLNAYNTGKADEDRIIYTDMSALVTDTFNTMLNSASIVLIVFAAISLVVSSIMIGIITYVSVIERTKEIGVLRSIGARKKDISRVFNAETFLIGFTAGLLGVLISLILTIPINLIINAQVADVGNLAALNPFHAIALVVLSTLLTLIAGLIPSRIAAKKDPVVALRNE